jgi:V/A-type H+-transporting ATPase subunit A
LVPGKRPGDELGAGEPVGYIEEGGVRHPAGVPEAAGTVARLTDGDLALDEPVAELADGRRLFAGHDWPVRLPRPCRRRLPATEPLITGQRCLDFLFPLARGGTAILPGGFGTGKTILEQAIAKFAAADVVVYVGCGERGNEMAEMLGPLLERTIVVVNTSNMPVAAREASIYTAVTMAEYYRDLGCHVLLLADSLSRWAEALREISSALEEMPGEEGYPTYLSSRLAGFLARAGVVETLDGRIGSVSMILSVSPPGGDFTEPVTQACLRAAGALYLLDTVLAHRRHFPALHWSRSYSLYADRLAGYFEGRVARRWREWRRECRELLQREEELRQVAEVVGSEGLQDADRLLMQTADRIRREFLCQNAYTEDAFSPPEQTAALIGDLLETHRQERERLEKG